MQTFKHLLCAVALVGCGDNRAAVHDAPPSPDAAVAPIDAPRGATADAPADAPLTGCGSSDDCDTGEVCHWAPQHACGRDQARGACALPQSHFCPGLAFWVCGCDGNNYFNECLSHAHQVDVDYGGPCRPAGVLVPCTTSADCPADDTFEQFCVDDPRDACDPNNGDTGCAGVCVHGNQACSDTLPCLSTGSPNDVQSPDTEACIAIDGADPDSDPAECVYTTRMRCTSEADCGSGELCMRDIDCPGALCLGWCVRP